MKARVEDEILSLWTIYEKPADYPLGFVARRFEVHTGHAVATLDAHYGSTLASVREKLPPSLYAIARCAGDDPCVVETWI